LSSIYIANDRYAGQTTLRSILARLDDEAVAQIAHEMASVNIGEWLSFRFNEISVASELKDGYLFTKYGGLGEAEFAPEGNGEDYAIVIKHSLGERWSALFGKYRNLLHLPNAEVKITANTVKITGIPSDIIRAFIPAEPQVNNNH